jgi:hypothetical protein
MGSAPLLQGHPAKVRVYLLILDTQQGIAQHTKGLAILGPYTKTPHTPTEPHTTQYPHTPQCFRQSRRFR